ncbi:MAG: hypothetical protein N2C13_02125 [Chloroflexota bacterium]
MNFPDTPFFTLIYWLINTPGLGGIIAILLGPGIMLAVGFTLRWIMRGSQESEPEEFSYPTATLLHDHQLDE